MPIYDERYVCPLSVRFSQARIRPTFRDGRYVEASAAQITSRQATPDEARFGYDVILEAPFPDVEVIRWRPRRSRGRGTSSSTGGGRHPAYGDQDLWYTIDNRRLYCLQRAALAVWPKTAAVAVQVLRGMPSQSNSVRKFDNSSGGRVVSISRRYDVEPHAVWDWRQTALSLAFPAATQQQACAAVARDEDRDSGDLFEPAPVSSLVMALRAERAEASSPLGALAPAPEDVPSPPSFALASAQPKPDAGVQTAHADLKEGQDPGRFLLGLLNGDAGGLAPGGAHSLFQVELPGASCREAARVDGQAVAAF